MTPINDQEAIKSQELMMLPISELVERKWVTNIFIYSKYIDRQIWKYWPFLSSKTWFYVIMKSADIRSEWHKYQMKWLLLFILFELVYLVSPTSAPATAAQLSDSVRRSQNIDFNLNPWHLPLKPKAFLWMCSRSVQSVFRLAPNLLGSRSTLWWPVRDF